MLHTRAWVLSSVVGIAILLAARAVGPGLHPCARLERSICEDLGAAKCAQWRERGLPGMPDTRPALRGRGRGALADVVFALALSWDPREPLAACRGLSSPHTRASVVARLTPIL